MSWMVTLGIFDDGDIAPTEFVMSGEDDDVFTLSDVAALQVAAYKAYGPYPDHAQFWSARTETSTSYAEEPCTT